jgi:hypothetical protein
MANPAMASAAGWGDVTRLFGRDRRRTLVAGDIAKSIRTLFAQDTGSSRAPERFDHAAARLYLGAGTFPVAPDQAAIIQRLKILSEQRSTPLVEEYVKQDPHYGCVSLAALVQGTYGEFLITNNRDPRLNHNPMVPPPIDLAVHLCWGIGYTTASSDHALQGVVALLLDDWRSALAPLRVNFHAHRMSPRPLSRQLGRTGPRWHDAGGESLPPAEAVGILFERANCADAALVDSWRIEQGDRGGWFCACLSPGDLPELDFKPLDADANLARQSWVSRRALLPYPISHVLLVPPGPGVGAVMRVVWLTEGVRLEPLDLRWRGLPNEHYENLRSRALDLLLAVICNLVT